MEAFCMKKVKKRCVENGQPEYVGGGREIRSLPVFAAYPWITLS